MLTQFTYMRSPSISPEKAEALHSLDEQAARGMLDKSGFVSQAATLLNMSPGESEQHFFHSNDRNQRLVELAQELRKSYKVAMLSNIGGDMMDGFFSPQERQQLFDVVVLSGDVKMAKPDRVIFELTCNRLGVKLSEVVMIDDMQINCDIVKGFGMQSICYKNFEQCNTGLTALIQ
jgi:putative hydrolase of the HAD superfamily